MKTTSLAVFATVAFASAANGQTLEASVKNARGTVGFEFTTRYNVCGNGSSITISDDTSPGWTTRTRRSGIHMGRSIRTDDGGCEIGPARAILVKDGNAVSEVRITVGGRAERADVQLGAVSTAEATRYLLSIAPQLTGRAADDAIMGAAIADSAVVWRRLLEIARDNNSSESSRKSSLFWVSQEAGDAATVGLSSIASDDDAQSGVRSDALFFLAQRPHGEGIPGLIKVVQESKSKKLRKDAIWFLSQSKDPRALDLFEKILAGR